MKLTHLINQIQFRHQMIYNFNYKICFLKMFQGGYPCAVESAAWVESPTQAQTFGTRTTMLYLFEPLWGNHDQLL